MQNVYKVYDNQYGFICPIILEYLTDMRNLIAFITKYYHWFLFLLLEIVGFVLLFKFNSYQGSAWLSTANAITGKVYEIDSDVESFFSLKNINRQLTLHNIYLEQQVESLNNKLLLATRDSSADGKGQLAAFSAYKLIPAQVVSNSVNRHDNFITINCGRADGVKDGMGVVAGTGVVGIVYLVSEHYSVVIPVLSSKSSISCSLQGRGYFGYLHWTGGNPRLAWLDDVPRHAVFRLYDKVVTNGYSAVFPSGILVGKVLHVYNSPDGLSYRIQVELSTDFANLRDVCVIDNAPLEERLDVLRAAKDSMKLKND